MTPGVSVEAFDPSGKPAVNATIDLRVYSGPGGFYATVYGSIQITPNDYVERTNSEGIATFSGVQLGETGTYKLIANVDQPTVVRSAPSASFSVIAGSAGGTYFRPLRWQQHLAEHWADSGCDGS